LQRTNNTQPKPDIFSDAYVGFEKNQVFEQAPDKMT